MNFESFIVGATMRYHACKAILGDRFSFDVAMSIDKWLQENEAYLPDYLDERYTKAAIYLHQEYQIRVSAA